MNNFASVPTPVPSKAWVESTPMERMNHLEGLVGRSASLNGICILEAKENGHVIVRCNFPVNMRGNVLLNFEDHLKDTVDMALTVWLEPMGDKNSLRNLRGIEIRHE